MSENNFMRLKIYLDLLQYAAEEQKQIAAHNRGNGASRTNSLRNLDSSFESTDFPKYHVDVLLSRNNSYDILMVQNDQLKSQKMGSVPTNTNGAMV